ncbi:MAG: hypothetical protein WD627_05760 [Actinomycetota bacterium]
MRLRRGAVHALHLTAAGLLAGMVAGAVAGLGSRLVMYAIRLMNSSHIGEFTHANSEVGRFTLDGTLALAIEGMFFGVQGAVVYLIVRRWIPGVGVIKGLLFGLVLLVVGAPAVLDGNYEYFRFVPTWVAVALFSLLYPLFGVVVSPLTERLGRGASGPPRNRRLAWSGYVVLGAILLLGLVINLAALRHNFGSLL